MVALHLPNWVCTTHCTGEGLSMWATAQASGGTTIQLKYKARNMLLASSTGRKSVDLCSVSRSERYRRLR